MDHNDIRHKLSEYIDNAVAPEERSVIDDHLKTCAACTDALAELRKTIEQVKQIEEVEAPAWMTGKIMATVRAGAETKKGFLLRLFTPLAANLPIQAVAVLFLTVTVFYIYTSMNPAEKYGEAPIERFAKQASPAEEQRAAKGKAPEVAAIPEKKVAQEPGYRSLDMKYAYEKPAPPAPAPPGAGIMAARDEFTQAPAAAGKGTGQALPAEEYQSGAKLDSATKAEVPLPAAKPAAPSAGAVRQTDARREVLSQESKAGRSSEADTGAEALLEVTEHFVKVDLLEKMKVKGLQYHTRKFEAAPADMEWMGKSKAFRSSPCSSRYVVDVDLSGVRSKYLYCYDRSRVRLLGIYDLQQDRWSERPR